VTSILLDIDGGAEYYAPYHPEDEMVRNIPHHSMQGKAILLSASKCYA